MRTIKHDVARGQLLLYRADERVESLRLL
ncbi:hypothetical protein CBM2605_A240084 [Cupriavidus neocaledonicus]|uniref:Uncharacterized protein n=1 Tax=Cupriavidus neocaledonicus TaxID=1040979 RepID=A0ABY1V0Z2_9BURK|nr:hypothetical protein CBM2605_A240084 [Cupriavidus neocaledonicus]